MVAGGLADVAVADLVARRDDEDSALLEWVPLGRLLPGPAPERPDAGRVPGAAIAEEDDASAASLDLVAAGTEFSRLLLAEEASEVAQPHHDLRLILPQAAEADAGAVRVEDGGSGEPTSIDHDPPVRCFRVSGCIAGDGSRSDCPW
jgi:hypothetical protein